MTGRWGASDIIKLKIGAARKRGQVGPRGSNRQRASQSQVGSSEGKRGSSGVGGVK